MGLGGTNCGWGPIHIADLAVRSGEARFTETSTQSAELFLFPMPARDGSYVCGGRQ